MYSHFGELCVQTFIADLPAETNILLHMKITSLKNPEYLQTHKKLPDVALKIPSVKTPNTIDEYIVILSSLLFIVAH